MNYFSIMNARSEFDFPISQAHFRFPIENTEKKIFYVVENLVYRQILQKWCYQN